MRLLLRPIDIERLLEAGYVEVDHALPYSRSFDDSKNNKVLTFTSIQSRQGQPHPLRVPRWCDQQPSLAGLLNLGRR